MTQKKPDNADESSLFLNAMTDTIPLAELNQVDLRPAPAAPKVREWHDEADDSAPDMLSDSGEIEKVHAETVLSYCRTGIQNRLFRRLRQGKLQITEELDLHGLNLKQAKPVLLDFIQLAYPIEGCCVRIIHGKSSRSHMGEPAVMKQFVNHWLQQHPRVMAFHSAQPRDGGTGSVYVILRRSTHPF
ncbi:MAG: DNA mismatch repair protein MutS [Proteobacteria bacterium]|nr:MAG: DNA mismatch repair protein MutS [Pseudomonadota bacterium]